MSAKILQVNMWRRDFDGKWTVCILRALDQEGELVRRQKRTFETLSQAMVFAVVETKPKRRAPRRRSAT